jgi:RNA polymerase sigma-70 factor, ECF subfamily
MREIGVESKFGSEPEADTLAFVEGFEAFYRRERRPLIALAYAVSGSRVGAEDLAQEALEAAFRDWDRIRQKESPGTWVRRILLNKATSHYRRRVTEAKVLAKSSVGIPTVAFPDVTGDIDRIWAEVRRLPRRQVQVIALAYMEGLNQVEIAATLGISKESVNTHLRRARQTLAESLGLEET